MHNTCPPDVPELYQITVESSVGKKVTFAHGTHINSAQSIAENGLDAVAAATHSRGGLLNQRTAFDAHPIGPPGNAGPGFQEAYEWSLRHAGLGDRRILIGEIDEALFQRLVKEGKVKIDDLPGVKSPQWRFLPEAFDEVNANVIWSILDPKK